MFKKYKDIMNLDHIAQHPEYAVLHFIIVGVKCVALYVFLYFLCTVVTYLIRSFVF